MARKTVHIHKEPSEIHITLQQIREMATLGFTRERIAEILNCKMGTLKKALLSDEDILTAFNEGRKEGQLERRRKRRELYNDGFWPALKHALNTEDNLIEKSVSEVTGKDGKDLIPNESLLANLIDVAQKDIKPE